MAEPVHVPVTYVITGTSGGIGLELTKQLAARNDSKDIIYALCRTRASSATGEDKLSDLQETYKNIVVIEGVDVASDDVAYHLQQKLQNISIDVIIHNAGSANATRKVVSFNFLVFTISMQLILKVNCSSYRTINCFYCPGVRFGYFWGAEVRQGHDAADARLFRTEHSRSSNFQKLMSKRTVKHLKLLLFLII